MPISTTVHSRSNWKARYPDGSLIRGSTAVRVFSVNSCWRARMTARNPTGYPRLVTMTAPSCSGSLARNSPIAISERPMVRPAASADQPSAATVRSSS
ncbi:hypothetical protein D3C78_1578910 [compost metagenome]